ncbi:hypothetical protein WN51_06126 [Melipona quadrifasciata]|uniref:Uncharacterized protein n=1 Tax=Melipona quadrifasciata TaxID=166423 RepID=A0A0N0U342_9HYME|nr:hypothetical protein WN51_06126 [Melipona quadrifasciata]
MAGFEENKSTIVLLSRRTIYEYLHVCDTCKLNESTCEIVRFAVKIYRRVHENFRQMKLQYNISAHQAEKTTK